MRYAERLFLVQPLQLRASRPALCRAPSHLRIYQATRALIRLERCARCRTPPSLFHTPCCACCTSRRVLLFALQYPEADILTSSDHLTPTSTGMGLERWPEAGSAANIGVMLFRPSAHEFAKVSPCLEGWGSGWVVAWGLGAGIGDWGGATCYYARRDGLASNTGVVLLHAVGP